MARISQEVNSERLFFGDSLLPEEVIQRAKGTFIISKTRQRARVGTLAAIGFLSALGAACGKLSAFEPGSPTACPDGQPVCSFQDGGMDGNGQLPPNVRKVDGGYILVGPDGGPIRDPDGGLVFVNPDGGPIEPMPKPDAGDAGRMPDAGPDAGRPDAGPLPVVCQNDGECNDHNACTEGERCAPLAPDHNEKGCVSGTSVNIDDGIPCTRDGCDPATGVSHEPDSDACPQTNCQISECSSLDGCKGTPLPDGTPCEVDGDSGECQLGSCAKSCVANVDCNDGKSCTIDACGIDLCANVASHFACDDGQHCNGVEQCNPASPLADSETGCAPAEVMPVCDDEIPCTEDRCDEDHNACAAIPRHDRCDDHNPCSGEEICNPVSGCQTDPANPPVECDLAEPCNNHICNPVTGACETVARPNGTLCENLNLCTVNDVCFEGSCADGDPRDCTDGNLCTDDSCFPAFGCDNRRKDCSFLIGDATECRTADCKADTGECEVNNFPNGTSCEDDRYCTDNDQCLGGFCTRGPDRECDDGISCTIDQCSDVREICDNVPNDADCRDDRFCNGVETCDMTRGCLPGTPPSCTDTTCQVGVCNPDTNDCETTPVMNGTGCDDSDRCTASDTCLDGACVGGPPPTEVAGNGVDDDCDSWTDESIGVDFRCEPGGALTVPDRPSYSCRANELVALPSSITFTAALPTHRVRPDRSDSRAILGTLVPLDFPTEFPAITARRGAGGDSVVRWDCNDIGMPPPPADKKRLCYASPHPPVATEGEIVTFEVTTRP